MERPDIHNRHSRIHSLKKILGIASLVVAILCLMSGMALANPSTDAKKEADSLEKTGIWIAAGTGWEDRDHLEMRQVPVTDEAFSLSEEEGEDVLAEERTPLPVDEGLSDRRLVMSNLLLDSVSNTPGHESKTHTLFKATSRPAPTIVLVEEHSYAGELYLALLNLTIPW